MERRLAERGHQERGADRTHARDSLRPLAGRMAERHHGAGEERAVGRRGGLPRGGGGISGHFWRGGGEGAGEGKGLAFGKGGARGVEGLDGERA